MTASARWRTFRAHCATVRGQVRYALVARQLELHLPPSPALVVDVGGGAGHQAIQLARSGYQVTLLDPSQEMLGEARKALDAEEDAVRGRVELVEGVGEQARELLGAERFEVVLCHGVVMHVEDPASLNAALASLARPGAVISVLAKNRDALAMRAGLEGRWSDAIAALSSDCDVGGLGVPTRGDSVSDLFALFRRVSVEPVAWYGLRVFTDHLGDQAPGPDLPEILELEWEAGRRDPYRSVARLIHLVGKRKLTRVTDGAGRSSARSGPETDPWP